MPWDYLLGSAGGAGIVLVLGILFAQRVLERTVDSRFDVKLEQLRGEMSRRLEFDRSDLAVWADLRKDILVEMWQAHRAVVKAMTTVILKVQELASRKSLSTLKPTVEAYRQTVHSQIDLLSPEAVDICQRFLGTAYDLASGRREADDASALKAIRHELYTHMAVVYGLEKMMPWMAQERGYTPAPSA